MSRFIQHFTLRCHGCYNKAERENRHLAHEPLRRRMAILDASRSITVIGQKGPDGVLCRCENCHKESVRYSRAAHHALQLLLEEQAKATAV